jgi:hypothetical protein
MFACVHIAPLGLDLFASVSSVASLMATCVHVSSRDVLSCLSSMAR